ncbi:protein farnesyltransferase [Cordyceps fumosorosea ARSEF 2679]|uniref:Protein farnesyltransferase/geranylgeranyltransferase type-1 subunit alpha n=1 Tax=Cordyceps fumosorosea (strain ARSEF 2679) TaxID=1081104 RepID=A0A167P8T8_CORFA|nr:protein farnesyltransferase [Cordyceps fumosorosea ARSEF 2679]OAA56404.1 protein farnesyltransferase [Cordyceps fumosorosea ARSEF 2679]
MPSKSKGTVKASPDPKEHQQQPPQAQQTPPSTVADRTRERFHATNPLASRVQTSGLSSLTAAEKKTFVYSQLLQPVAQQRVPLSNKTEREFWKAIAKEGLPIRRLRPSGDYIWGPDKAGRDVGSYSLAEHETRSAKQARLTALRLLSQQYRTKRDLARHSGAKGDDVTAEETETEKTRRKEMAALNRELYGDITGALASDPEWDDVVPIVHNEPEDAIARIAYPDDYAEAVAYLRAVMADKEYSPRTLRLTALVIALNPAHYTVWLFRFEIVKALAIPVPDEIAWLNEVALENLKNYQIWHHRQLLLEHHLPQISADDAAVAALGRSEAAFLATMLAEDAKNYHVWSYRQHMVRRLRRWDAEEELAAAEALVDDDPRNNSAWSHRFFLVFQDPAASTPGCGPAERDPAVPAEVVAREVAYARGKIALAPQNQSAWNYLRAALAKGGRELGSERELAEGLVDGLGTEAESVRSSHALDYLADVYAQAGDADKARLCLQRLSEKWDPIREGYWKYRVQQLV